MYTLVLLRHGQSTWNKENRFTGWVDVDLSEQGVREAHDAGITLRTAGLDFDVAYTSVLKRAIRTLWITLDELDRMWLPVHRAWQLNERFYGGLSGLNKSETAEKHGEEQVKLWRRGFAVQPPELETSSEYWPGNDPRYAGLTPEETPVTESLKDTIARVLPYWNECIVPDITSGKRVIIAAHGNSLRALVMHLDQMSEDDIMATNIPTGLPLVYELDADMRPISKKYLGDPAAVEAAMAAVAAQGAAKSGA